MGVLNVTPDSFSDGGLFDSVDESAFLDRGFDSCTHESSRLNHHEIMLEGGQIELDVGVIDMLERGIGHSLQGQQRHVLRPDVLAA